MKTRRFRILTVAALALTALPAPALAPDGYFYGCNSRRPALRGAHPGRRARRACERGLRGRRAAARAEQLREPRLPGLARNGRDAELAGVCGRKVLSPRTLDRRANSRGARVHARARRARDSGGRAARGRWQDAARIGRIPFRGVSTPRWAHAGARRPQDA